MQDLSSTETYSLGLVVVACLAILYNAWQSDGEPLFASLAISGIGYAFSYALIRWTGDVFLKRGYKGRDMAKKNPIEMWVLLSARCKAQELTATPDQKRWD